MPEANAIARMRDDRMAARRDAQNPESDTMRAGRSPQIKRPKASQPAEPARHQPDIIKLF
jgi:hypothetical protein